MTQHPYISRVEEPPDPCFCCGGSFTGFRDTPDGRVPTDRSVFVQLKVQGGEPVTPGGLLTQHEEPGRTVRMHRAPDGSATPVYEVHPQVCGECVSAMHRVAGLDTSTAIWVERAAERDRADRAEKKVTVQVGGPGVWA